MRFLCLYKPGKPETGAPPTQHEMDAMGKLIGEMMQAGVLISTEGCQPSAKGARVRLDNGQFTVVDGPFSEAKELVGGMAVIQAEPMLDDLRSDHRYIELLRRMKLRA